MPQNPSISFADLNKAIALAQKGTRASIVAAYQMLIDSGFLYAKLAQSVVLHSGYLGDGAHNFMIDRAKKGGRGELLYHYRA